MLLSKIVRFLNSKDVSFESIQNLINESTTAQLVPSFAFLGFWLSSNSNNSSSTAQFSTVQSANHLMELISLKVPPVILLSGMIDLNWGSHQSHWSREVYFSSIFERLEKIQAFVRPLSLDGHVLRWSHCFPSKNHDQLISTLPLLSDDYYTDSKYQNNCLEHFMHLIEHRQPIDAFKPILERRNGKLILTFAIIQMLSKLNNVRNAKHSQLLFMFSVVFYYIQSFAATNEIDGQILCEYLQSRPFVSPFCMAGIVNHISPLLYLFNLLIPRKLALGDIEEETAKEAILAQYPMVDLTGDTELNPYIERLPEMLYIYFLQPTVRKAEAKMPTATVTDRLILVQLIEKNMTDRSKAIFNCSMKQYFEPIIACVIAPQLIINVFKWFSRCLGDTKGCNYLTKNLCSFVSNLLSLSLPTNSDNLTNLFKLNAHNPDPFYHELLLKGAYKYLIASLLPLPLHKHFYIYLFLMLRKPDEKQPVKQEEARKKDERQVLSRIFFSKLLRTNTPTCTQAICDELMNCADLCVILDFIEACSRELKIKNSEEASELSSIIDQLIKKLPIVARHDKKSYIVITDIIPNRPGFNQATKEALMILQGMPQISANELANHLRNISNPVLGSNVTRILASSSLLEKSEHAMTITDFAIKSLLDQKNITYTETELFGIPVSSVMYTISQLLLKHLLLNRQSEYALSLLDAMTTQFLNDKVPLHWLVPFMSETYKYLTPIIKRKINELVIQLPCAEELYVPYNGKDNIRKICDILSARLDPLLQEPDIITLEYSAPMSHAIAFAVVSFLVRDATPDEIVQDLIRPFVDFRELYTNRENDCGVLMILITYLPKKIGYKWFSNLIERPVHPLTLDTMRQFMVFAPIELFKKICNSSMEFCKKSNEQLFSLLYITMPSFGRLKKDEAVATKFLCGILENVNYRTTPFSLQERIVDSVGLVYVTLKLQKSRTTLIKSAKQFTPELKAIIASSLDIDEDQKPTRVGKSFSPQNAMSKIPNNRMW